MKVQLNRKAYSTTVGAELLNSTALVSYSTLRKAVLRMKSFVDLLAFHQIMKIGTRERRTRAVLLHQKQCCR